MGMNYYLRLKGVYGQELIKNFPEPEYRDLQVQVLENGYVWKNKYYPMLSDLNNEYYYSLHIGKNSAGWVFGLRVLPDCGIKDLEDWKKLFNLPNAKIYDEEDEEISKEQMLSIITEKVGHKWALYGSDEAYEKAFVEEWNKRYEEEQEEEQRTPRWINLYSRKIKDYDDYLTLKELGGALRGPNGLLRRRSYPEHKVIEVKGATYDLIVENDNYGW